MLVPLKGLDILVRAAAIVVKQGLDDLLVLIAGEGEERSRLEKVDPGFKDRKLRKTSGPKA